MRAGEASATLEPGQPRGVRSGDAGHGGRNDSARGAAASVQTAGEAAQPGSPPAPGAELRGVGTGGGCAQVGPETFVRGHPGHLDLGGRHV